MKQKYWNTILALFKILITLIFIAALTLNPPLLTIILEKETEFSQTTKNSIYLFQLTLFITATLLFTIYKLFIKKCTEHQQKFIAKLLLTTSIIIITIFSIEITTRIFSPQQTLHRLTSQPPPIYEETDYFSWKYKPNATGKRITGEFDTSYKINSYGMRDIERPLQKKQGITRIIVLGDSFTAGFGVEQNETYPSQLEKNLNEQGKKVEVWNAGIDGYSPDVEYLQLKKIITDIKPDIVLLGFYVGNDVLDIERNQQEYAENGKLIKIITPIATVKNNQLQLIENEKNPYKPSLKTYLDIVLLRTSHFYRLIKNRIDTEMLSLLQNANIVSWEKTNATLSSLSNLSKQYHSQFYIVIIPPRAQVAEKEWKNLQKKIKNISFIQPQQKLLNICSEQNISCVDLLPELKNTKKQLYYTYDAHFTPSGHRLTAEIISKNLSNSFLKE